MNVEVETKEMVLTWKEKWQYPEIRGDKFNRRRKHHLHENSLETDGSTMAPTGASLSVCLLLC